MQDTLKHEIEIFLYQPCKIKSGHILLIDYNTVYRTPSISAPAYF